MEEIKLSYPVHCYPEEAIKKALKHITGDSPLGNIIDITSAMCSLVMGDDGSGLVQDSYYCLYSYLEFQLELLKSIDVPNE
jgi:hypothetical protein